MVRNDRNIVALQSMNAKPILYVYTSSGMLLTQFQVQMFTDYFGNAILMILDVQLEKGRLIAMGWTKNEKLVCVMEYGFLKLYDLHGDSIQITLGDVSSRDWSVASILLYR